MVLSRFDYRGVALAVLFVSSIVASGCSIKTTAKDSSTTTSNSAVNPTGTAVPVADTGSTAKPSETINIEGSSTIYPICQQFAVEFEKNTKHKISLSRNGTGGGYKKFIIQQCDIWNASRPIATKEVDELKAKGIEWIELTIAVDGIVVAVNPHNTWCSNLTCAQLKKIWEPDSKVKTWSDLDSAWPKDEIRLYGADVDSGTFEYFTEVINDKKMAINTRYTPSSDDNVLVQGVASNKNGLGFIPFGYYIENTEKLKALGISPTKDEAGTAKPFVEPTVETILSEEYAPLARPLFMYPNKKVMLERPEVAEFMKFAVSEAAQPLVEKRGFVRVKEELRQQMAKRLDEALSEKTALKK